MLSSWLKRFLWLNRVHAITKDDVEPSPISEYKEKEIQVAQHRMQRESMKLERASWRVREQLAGHVVNIVAGERK